MAGFQEEDFNSAFDKCSERDAHCWLAPRIQQGPGFYSGIVWVQESKKATFSFVLIQSLVLESFYVTLGFLICLEWYCHVHQGTINMDAADVQSE